MENTPMVMQIQNAVDFNSFITSIYISIIILHFGMPLLSRNIKRKGNI